MKGALKMETSRKELQTKEGEPKVMGMHIFALVNLKHSVTSFVFICFALLPSKLSAN